MINTKQIQSRLFEAGYLVGVHVPHVLDPHQDYVVLTSDNSSTPLFFRWKDKVYKRALLAYLHEVAKACITAGATDAFIRNRTVRARFN